MSSLRRLARAGIVGIGVGCAALVPVTPGYADPSVPCQSLELTISTELNPVPDVYSSGVYGVRTGVIHNGFATAFPGMTFDFTLGTNNEHPGSAPSVQWSFAGGGWRTVPIEVSAYPHQGLQYWAASNVPMPDLPPGDTTVRLRVAFRADNPNGSYDTQFNLSSSACPNTMLGSDTAMDFFYYLTPNKPAPTPRQTTAPATSRPTPPADAPVTPSIADSPSPAATPSTPTQSESVVQGGEDAVLVAGSPQPRSVALDAPARGSALPWLAAAGAALVLLAAATPLWTWRRRQPGS